MRFLALFALVFAAGCGGDTNVNFGDKDSNKNESYSYQFNENGCDTGKQSFGSKDAYCAGLANEQLNKGCAPMLRQQMRERECR